MAPVSTKLTLALPPNPTPPLSLPPGSTGADPGPRERHIDVGSSLTLLCVVTSRLGPATLVYWYHDTALLDYNSPRGGVTMQVIEAYKIEEIIK